MLFFLAVTSNVSERSKLEDLYKRHGSLMYKVAYKILHDEFLAQDAVHEAFLRISKNLEKINEVNCNKTQAFIVIIIRSVSIDFYRRRKNHSALPLDEMNNIPESGPGVEDMAINNTMFEAMAAKINELPSHYADIIALKYFYHYEYEEIAQILNISIENARTRMHRAKQNLIKLIAEEQEVANHESTINA